MQKSRQTNQSKGKFLLLIFAVFLQFTSIGQLPGSRKRLKNMLNNKEVCIDFYFPVGFGSARHLIGNPYLYPGFHAFNFSAELKINKNHFVGFDFYAGDNKVNYGALINYFEPNDKAHTDLIKLTKGLHHFVEIGPCYSLSLNAWRFFLKNTISAGLHKVRQQTQSINYYPGDTTNYSKKTFTTDKYKRGPSGWGYYGAIQCELGYRFKLKNQQEEISCSLGARYTCSQANLKSTYYEQFNDGGPTNQIYYSDTYVSRNLDLHLGIGIYF
jgi:hypothetical protein